MRVGLAIVAVLLVLAPWAAARYQPPELKDPDVLQATADVANAYGGVVPGLDAPTLLWFLYAIEHRESSFDAGWCNVNDGAAAWNAPRLSYTYMLDGIPHGCGLTQLTGWTHAGMPYPGGAADPPARLDKGVYGEVVPPRPVTPLTDPRDPRQNLERFVTEEVLPDYVAIQATHPGWAPRDILRAVAYHWNHGEWAPYDPNECEYLCLYDRYAAEYERGVAADMASRGASGRAPAAPAAPASGGGWLGSSGSGVSLRSSSGSSWL